MEGKQIRGLMEAYSEVYQPSIITEEVVQEAADMWVEACIAYGIDFSEYTLDELTESFIVDMSSEELSESVLNEILGMPGAQNLGAGLRQKFGQARRAVGGAIKKVGKGVLDVAGATNQGYIGQRTTSKNPLARAGNQFTRNLTALPRAAASFGAGFLTGKPGATKPTANPSPSKPAPAKPEPKAETKKPAPTGKPAPAKPAPDRDEPLWGPGSSKPSAPAKPADQGPDRDEPLWGPGSSKPSAPSKPSVPSTPKPQLSARAQAIKSGQSVFNRDPRARAGFDPRFDKKSAPKPAPVAKTPPVKKAPPGGFSTKEGDGKTRETQLFHTDLYDLVKGYLLDEGFASTEESADKIILNMSEAWFVDIMELTGGKGHPGYKAGSKDHGDLEDHPAAGKKGGVLSPRYGNHLGDMDDEDEDEDDLESVVKQQSRDRRETVRKPLRDKVKAARKKMTKEELEYVDEGIIDAAKAGSKRHKDAMKGAGRAIKKAGIRARKLGKALEPAADTAKSAASGVGKAAKATYEAGKKTGEFVKKGAQRHNDMVKAAKKVFNKEELELIAQIMIDEGYNLSDYTWEEFHTLCLDAEMLDENRAAARAAGGYKDDSEDQPDPSKDGFTGIGKMTIKDIMALNKKIEARKKKIKEELVSEEDFSEGARNPEVEEKGKKVGEYERAGKYQGITSKFRKEHPGSREAKKEKGRKQTEGELEQERIKIRNARVAKYGFTKKEKKESKAREKYDSPRD